MSLRATLSFAALITISASVPAGVSAQSTTGPGADRPAKRFVHIEAVIRPDGTVGDVKITQSIDTTPEVNSQVAEAVKALKLSHFTPPVVAGRPLVITLSVDVPVETAQADDFTSGAYAPDTPNLQQPVLLKSVEPKYTSDAVRAKIQGDAVVEVIVGVQGTVTKARVVQSLDRQYGLDEEAVKAAQAFLFKPGMLNGKPVPVDMRIVMTFRLR